MSRAWIWVFPQSESIGGTERRTLEVVPAYLDAGDAVEAHLLGPSWGTFARSLREGGVSVHTYDSRLAMIGALRRANSANSTVFAFEKNAALMLLLTGHKFHPYLMSQASQDALHGRFKRRLSRLLMGRCDLVVANSREAMRFAQTQYDLDEDRVVVLDPVVAESWIRKVSEPAPHPDQNLVGMVGNWRPEKRYDLACDVLAQLPSRYRLRIYTNKSEPVVDLFQSRGLLHRLEVVEGQLTTPSTYDQFGCLLHTAEFESIPRSILEARARGCPVAAFSSGSIAEYVPAAVAFGDTRTLAAQVMDMTANKLQNEARVGNGVTTPSEYRQALELLLSELEGHAS